MEYCNMDNPKLNPSVESDRHECSSFRNGDWLIYYCLECRYELRENWRTGELRVHNSQANVKHYGGYFPYEYKEAFENLN